MVAGHEGRQQPVIGIVPWRGVQGAHELEQKALHRGNGLVVEYQERAGARILLPTSAAAVPPPPRRRHLRR